jgi:hypothetical protein
VVRLKSRGEAIFQGRHRPGDRSRRAPQTPGGGNEAALLGDGDESGKLVETVHRIVAESEIDRAIFRQLNRERKLSMFRAGRRYEV